MSFEITQALEFPDLTTVEEELPKSLFNEHYDPGKPIQARVKGTNTHDRSLSISPRLLQGDQEILRKKIHLRLHKDHQEFPQTTATIDPDGEDTFGHTTFSLKFNLPIDISMPDPNLKEPVHSELLKFLMEYLVNPVQEFLQAHTK